MYNAAFQNLSFAIPYYDVKRKENKTEKRTTMEDRRVTISDIADELGLSTATVSNVLHGKTNKVSDRTVKKVQEVLEKRQYIPSMAGILLAQNNSRIIGIVINDHPKYESHVLEDGFIASALNALSTEIEKNGQFMMVKKAVEMNDIIRFASMWNLDGLVLIGYCERDYRYLRDHMRIPFVVYDGYQVESDRVCNITIDHYDGGFQMGEYFKKLGHEHCLCISDNESCMDKERYEGFCSGLGIKADFLMIPMEKEKRDAFYLEKLDELKLYSAVFAVSDYYAIDFMKFLQSHGISVPKDISVAGFDDSSLCTMITPALTSIRQDNELRAQTALNKLRELNADKDELNTDKFESQNDERKKDRECEKEIRLPVMLVERESTQSQFISFQK